jgi:hypothetical protein
VLLLISNSLNQLDYSKADSLGTANDVSTASEMSEHHYPQRSVSPVTISTGTGGKLSPQRSRLMRDQEMVRVYSWIMACTATSVCLWSL